MVEYRHRIRTYLHFDPQPSEAIAKYIATNPAIVAHHAFYPFLGFTIKTPRIKKLNGDLQKSIKERPIKIAAHLDAAIYGYYAQIISSLYEEEVKRFGIGESVTAFRDSNGKSNIHFANEVFRFINDNRPCVAIGLDITKFFDRLDHDVLKRRWQDCIGERRLPQDHYNIFKSLTNFTWVDRDLAYHALGISSHNPHSAGSFRNRICNPQVFRESIREAGLIWSNPEINSRRGIPQGAPISALLSNIYMLDFDKKINESVTAVGGLYRRYCDDIILVVPQENACQIEGLAVRLIAELNLSINRDKTTRAIFPKGHGVPAEDSMCIQYLGFNYDGKKKLIRAGSLSRYYGKMRKGVSLAKQTQRKHNRIEASKGHAQSQLKTRKLYIRYSYLIKRRFTSLDHGGKRQNENFITYAHKASRIMNAPEIKHQVRKHIQRLKAEIRKR